MYRVVQKKRLIRRSVIMEKNGLHHRFSRELALHFEYSLTPKKLILRPQGSKIKFKYYTFWVEMNHWAFLTLTLLILFDLDETFKDISDECSLPSDTISRSIRNVHVLQDSRKRLGGQVESWHGSWCQILMKLPKMLLMDVPSYLTPSPGPSGIIISS